MNEYEEAKDVLRNTAWMGTDNGEKVFGAIKIAIEALEKAEKYRWHDLRKNPDDLPKEDLFFKNILVTDGTYYMTDCSVYFDDEMGCISAESGGAVMYGIIAWREIEPFEEDNT